MPVVIQQENGVAVINTEHKTISITQTQQQVVMQGGLISGVGEAPKDGHQYARQDGNWTEVQASGGSPFLDAEDILYAALQLKIQNAEIEVGKYYRVTDYYSLNDAGFGSYYQSSYEPVIVQGVTGSQVSIRAYSDTYKNDIILYDVTDNVTSKFVFVEYDTGDNSGDVSVISTTIDTVTVDSEPTVNDDFYFYAEDDEGGEVEYEGDGLGDDFTITDNGNSTWTITDLTGDIDFANQDYVYIEGEWNTNINFPGRIIYREDPKKSIVCHFDFRNQKYYRAKINVAATPDYSSSTTYNAQQIVKYNNSLYVSKNNNNYNHAPTDTNYWHRILSNIDTYYFFHSSANFSCGTGRVYPSSSSADRELIPVFARQSGSTFVYDDSWVNHVTVAKSNNIFINKSGNAKLEWSSINGEHNTFCDSVSNTTFDDIKNSILPGSISSCSFGEIDQIWNAYYMQYVDIRYASNTVFVTSNSMQVRKIANSLIKLARAVIGYNNHDVALSGSDVVIGNNNSYIYARNMNFCSFGNSNTRMEFFMHPFANVRFGDLNKYMRFSGNNFTRSSFGTNCGKYGTWRIFSGNIIACRIGDNCFWNGQSAINSMTNVVMEGNSERIKCASIGNTVFGLGASDIQSYSVNNCVFGAGCFHILFGDTKMYGCVFDPAVQNLSMGTSDPGFTFKRNQVHASEADFGSSATHIFENYTCEVINLQGSDVNLPVKLMYYDNSGTQQIVDPDA